MEGKDRTSIEMEERVETLEKTVKDLIRARDKMVSSLQMVGLIMLVFSLVAVLVTFSLGMNVLVVITILSVVLAVLGVSFLVLSKS